MARSPPSAGRCPLPRSTRRSNQGNLRTMVHQLTREPLIDAITAFLAGRDTATIDAFRGLLEREIDMAGAAAITALGQRLASAGADWDYYPPDALARRLHHVLADRILLSDSALHGGEHITATMGKPVVIFAN